MKRLIIVIAIILLIPKLSQYGVKSEGIRGLDDTDFTETIGTTWYETQHHGTVGRMAEFDEDGYLHFAWMNGLNYGAMDRHIYYNFIDLYGNQGWPGTGYPVESSYRAGFVTLDAGYDGRAFPAFHFTNASVGDYNTGVAFDFFPRSGTFMTNEPPHPWVHEEEIHAGYPNVRIDRNGLIHIVSTTFIDQPGETAWHIYTVGIFDPLTFNVNFPSQPNTWKAVGPTQIDGVDMATSEVSDRLAVAWINPHKNIKLLIDEDGRNLNFNEAFILTQFGLEDTLFCHNDLSLLIDDRDYVHVAFTTRGEHINASLIMHWSEQYPDEFSVIADAWDPSDLMDCGACNVKAQRPSLAQQEETGYLYCSYQVYDTDSLHLSAGGYPSGEVYMTYSDDAGLSWDVGTNITYTITPQGAAPGQCYSEICPTMAKEVDEEYHVMYVLDKDAGEVMHGEGTWTLNDVVYDHWVYWWESDNKAEPPAFFPSYRDESSSSSDPVETISEAVHVGAAPNPFNLETTFTFELQERDFVTLDVFDLNSRRVETLVDGFRNGGIHEVTFDASYLPSGIYLYRLTTGSQTIAGKVILLK